LLVAAAAAEDVRSTTPLVRLVAVTFLVVLPLADTSAIVAMVMLGLVAHLSLESVLAEARNVMSAHCFLVGLAACLSFLDGVGNTEDTEEVGRERVGKRKWAAYVVESSSGIAGGDDLNGSILAINDGDSIR